MNMDGFDDTSVMAGIAQLAEQSTENPRVRSSNLLCLLSHYLVFCVDILFLSLRFCIFLLWRKQVELRDVDNGNKLNLRFGTEESVESMLLIP